MLIRITAPHFCAGVIVKDDLTGPYVNLLVARGAPILKWTIGKRWREVKIYCKRRGWEMEVVK